MWDAFQGVCGEPGNNYRLRRTMKVDTSDGEPDRKTAVENGKQPSEKSGGLFF